jgi:hypothetical protein
MKRDLIIVAADRAAQVMLIELLNRLPPALGLREFSWQVLVHENRDPGCYTKGVDKLDLSAKDFEHCILIFDHEGCGAEHKSPTEIQSELEQKLTNGLWPNRNAVIVIDPELENWVWTNSIHTSAAMGWGSDRDGLKSWLIAKDWLGPNDEKPKRPKEAMEASHKFKVKAPITSDTFATIAAKASFKSCTSPSFLKFKSTITTWFQAPNP